MALILTSDYNDARALVNDTMLRAQNGEVQASDGSQLRDWVFATMKSIFHSNYKNRQATVVDPTVSYYDLIADDSVEVPIEGVYSVHQLSLEICNFTPAYRIPYSLYVMGYHLEDIAVRTHTTIRRVKTLILRAEGRIRIKLSI